METRNLLHSVVAQAHEFGFPCFICKLFAMLVWYPSDTVNEFVDIALSISSIRNLLCKYMNNKKIIITIFF